MPDSIVRETLREITPLHESDPVGYAAKRVMQEDLPALPVVDDEGTFVGLFGEREFMEAMFPAYVGTLASARMIRRSIDETIERRIGCREEPISAYLTRDEVLVEDDYSDTQLAETFLHHRVMVVPVATNGHVHAVVTRNDFFRALNERLGDIADDYGD
jgi:CBS domain-containing protein